jgi:4'-phosphopantetheinyl transferase
MASDWLPPATPLVLSPGTVHVWRASLDRPADEGSRLSGALSADEQERASRFHFEVHRTRFVVCRGLLRAILGRYLGIAASQVRFTYGKHGKPALLEAPPGNALEFNASHSEGRALFAVTRDRSVGVDLEQIRPPADLAALVESVFSANEQAVFHALAAEQQLEAFFRCWTRKEAFMKATGLGMALAPERIDVTLAPEAPPRLLGVMDESLDTTHWLLTDLTPWPGYAAALAIHGPIDHLQCWDDI